MGEQGTVKGVAERRKIQSIGVGFRLIRALETHGRAMSLTELAQAGAMATSQAHLYLASFMQEQLVTQDRVSMRYQLGPYALQLGLAALRSTDAVAIARQVLEGLRARTGESGYLSIWSNRGPTIVATAEGRRQTPVAVRIGYVLPLLTSATGRVFLAHLAAAEQSAKGEASVEEIAALRMQVRRDGCAKTDGLLNDGFSGLASPVFDAFDQLACVLTLIGPRQDFDDALDGPLARALREAAHEASHALGAKRS